MNHEPPATAVAESYPTFWDETPPQRSEEKAPVQDPYSEFIDATEEELPDDPEPGTE